MFSVFMLKMAYLPYHVVICVCYQEKGAAFITLLYSVKFLTPLFTCRLLGQKLIFSAFIGKLCSS